MPLFADGKFQGSLSKIPLFYDSIGQFHDMLNGAMLHRGLGSKLLTKSF